MNFLTLDLDGPERVGLEGKLSLDDLSLLAHIELVLRMKDVRSIQHRGRLFVWLSYAHAIERLRISIGSRWALRRRLSRLSTFGLLEIRARAREERGSHVYLRLTPLGKRALWRGDDHGAEVQHDATIMVQKCSRSWCTSAPDHGAEVHPLDINGIQTEERERGSIHTRANSAAPCSLEQVKEYVNANDLDIDPDGFWDYYTALGWKGVQDWQAKARTWQRNEQSHAKRRGDKGVVARIECKREQRAREAQEKARQERRRKAVLASYEAGRSVEWIAIENQTSTPVIVDCLTRAGITLREPDRKVLPAGSPATDTQ